MIQTIIMAVPGQLGDFRLQGYLAIAALISALILGFLALLVIGVIVRRVVVRLVVWKRSRGKSRSTSLDHGQQDASPSQTKMEEEVDIATDSQNTRRGREAFVPHADDGGSNAGKEQSQSVSHGNGQPDSEKSSDESTKNAESRGMFSSLLNKDSSENNGQGSKSSSNQGTEAATVEPGQSKTGNNVNKGASQDSSGQQTEENRTTWQSKQNVDEVINSKEERQLAALAPRYVGKDQEHYEYLRTNNRFTRSYYIVDWPDEMRDGHLEDLFAGNNIDLDVGIHVDRVPTSQALDHLKKIIDNLEADRQLAEEDNLRVEASDLAADRDDYEDMRDEIRDGDEEMVDVSMYLSVAADTPKKLDNACDEVTQILEKNDFEAVLKTEDQKRTHRSATPVFMDELGKKISMPGSALAALMPFASDDLKREEGVPYGTHAMSGTPICYDRYEHEMGYSWLVTGNLGVGKSFSTSVLLQRRRLYDPDTLLVVLDPLRGFFGLNQLFDGQQITVGGDFGLNPLDIKKVPDEVLKENPQLDPGKAKLDDLKSFFESLFALRGESLGNKWSTLERALKRAYANRDIDLNDPSTHHREPPTIAEDLVTVLLDMITDPREHSIINDIVDNEQIADEVHSQAEQVTQEEQNRAVQLLLAMEPFLEGGSLENMGKHSELEIEGEDVIWLDLQQQEARGSLGLMMNLIFSAIYEKAKQTDKKIIFAIDEARYIMRDEAALDFLEHATRHSRHYDLSIMYITQTLNEFFSHEQATTIADLCSHRLHFRTDGMTRERADSIGLNPVQAEFIRSNATAGDEVTGYSEGVLVIKEEGKYPIHIRANPMEAAVADLEPGDEIAKSLPDKNKEPAPEIQALRQRLLKRYDHQDTEKIIPEVTAGPDGEVTVDRAQLFDSGPDLAEKISDVADDIQLDEEKDPSPTIPNEDD